MSIKEKLQSRKLWAAIAGVVTGLAMVFGLDETVINTVAGAVVAAAFVVSYIVTEGRIDAAAVSNAAEQMMDAVDVVGAELPGNSVTGPIGFRAPEDDE